MLPNVGLPVPTLGTNLPSLLSYQRAVQRSLSLRRSQQAIPLWRYTLCIPWRGAERLLAWPEGHAVERKYNLVVQ